MTVRYQMKLTGLEEYLERIVQAGLNVDASAAKAVEAGSEIVLDSMLEKVPVGQAPEDPHPGNLKKHVKRTQPQQDGNLIFCQIGVLDADANTAIYGNVQEYGSGSNSPQPYVRPAFDENKGKVRAAEKAVLEAEGVL